MSDLRSLQAWMQSALIAPRTVRASDVDATLKPSNRLSAAERLAIYQRSYISRLKACLAEQFPASSHALGPDLFDQFARVYLAETPSDSYTLYELGRRFPDYLNQTRPDADAPEADQEPWASFMVDLARYERQLFVLFDAPGHEGKPWPTADTPDEALCLQPCFALGQYRFEVAQYYHQVTGDSSPTLPPMHRCHVAITRFNYLTSTFPISAEHHRFLSLVAKTGCIDTALTQIAEELGLSEAIIRETWQNSLKPRWVANHFFIRQEDARP